jgi:cell division protein FtsZ
MEAATRAIASPLLEAGAIDGARGILINITGSSTLKLAEVNEASSIIQNAAHEDANIIFGAVLDEKMKDEVKITVIATGFRTDFVARMSESSRVSAAAAIQQARTAYHYEKPGPTINLRKDDPYEVRSSEPVAHVEVAPTAQAVEHAPVAHGAESHSVQEERKVTAAPIPVKVEYEQDDLDVPAFLRKKRTE